MVRAMALWFGLWLPMGAAAAPFEAFPVDAAAILQAIGSAKPVDLGGAAVTGLTLPHHRVASDLIASGMVTAVAGPKPLRIVLLTPDHFKRSHRAFATTQRDFATALGLVPVDHQAAAVLLRSPDVGSSILFEREHGVGELLPYIAHLFPGVPVLPVAIRIGATRGQWEALIQRLLPLVRERTLVIQSTDFSHYLPREQAVLRDQQMLNIIASGDLDALAQAQQPAQLDSRGAQYIQMRLQQQRFGARPVVFGNYNSADYGATGSQDTTSYVAQVYAAAAADRVVMPGLGAQTLCVVGDTFFGRHMALRLADAAARARLKNALRQRLRGCPLLLNLEGVLSERVQAKHPLQLVMPQASTLAWLKDLGVVAVSLANNHSADLGSPAYAAMVARLREAGLLVLEHGQTNQVGPLRVVAWRDLDNHPQPRDALLSAAELAKAAPADLALMHWGREYSAEPGQRERDLTAMLRDRGVPLIVGAHPHRASPGIRLWDGVDTVLVYSLGNFIFDQHGPRVSGAVLQISVFAQGTRALRYLALPDARSLIRGR